MYACMHVSMYVSMYVCICVYMYICQYVCMSTCVFMYVSVINRLYHNAIAGQLDFCVRHLSRNTQLSDKIRNLNI